MSVIDDMHEEIRRLRADVSALVGRVGRLEERLEMAIEAPPIEKRVVPPSVVGAAAVLGETLGESKRVTRSSKESARNLRRVVSPEDDTGRHLAIEEAPRQTRSKE